jgi:uncharacterized protein (DUF305 family)
MKIKAFLHRKLTIVGLFGLTVFGLLFYIQALNVSPLLKWLGVANFVSMEHADAVVLTPNAVDIGFAQAMMKHHDEALILSTLALHSANPAIEKLTHAIVMAQSHERGLMQGWLTAWGKPVVPSGGAMDWVDLPTDKISVEDLNYISRCKASEGGIMPGSPTIGDYELLKSSSGANKDRLFLDLMIKHHEAAVEMADFAGRHAQSDLIKSFTNRIKREQLKELLMMKGMLQSSK